MFDDRKVNAAFGRAAAHYDEHAQLQRAVREECITMGESVWKGGAHLLDLGCGTGAFTKETQPLGLDWRVTQLDRSIGMCASAQSANPATVNASADAIPFADHSFDGVFSSLMLQWVYDPLPVMREIARVMKPSGVCVLSTLTRGTLQELHDSFATLDDAIHVNAFADPAPLTALCVHGGFRLLACEEDVFTIDYPDVTALMRSLKAIGASTTQGAKKHGLMTPRQLKRLNQVYQEKFGKKNSLPATWQVLYMMLERI